MLQNSLIECLRKKQSFRTPATKKHCHWKGLNMFVVTVVLPWLECADSCIECFQRGVLDLQLAVPGNRDWC